MLSIRLEENDCFSAWVMGNDTNLPNTSDLKREEREREREREMSKSMYWFYDIDSELWCTDVKGIV